MIEEQLKQAVNDALSSGWTLRKLAEVLGVSNSQLSYWLRGQRSITIETAGKIANALDMQLTKAKIPKPE